MKNCWNFYDYSVLPDLKDLEKQQSFPVDELYLS